MSALTKDQLLAAASPAKALFLEAAPGSGKTTVAATALAFNATVADTAPTHEASWR